MLGIPMKTLPRYKTFLYRKKRRDSSHFRKTGSGKSTILSLISRMYDVTEGKITIDGNEISSVNLLIYEIALE
jgi:ABC-type enterochelin transport system ATPase subunit